MILRELAAKRDVDASLQTQLDRLVDAWDSGSQWSPQTAIEMIELRASMSTLHGAKPATDAKAQATAIKDDALYADPGIEESSNWFSRAMQRFGELISNWLNSFQIRPPPMNSNGIDPNALAGIGAVLKIIVYAVLVALLALFLFLVARHFRWRATMRRKAIAILEDDEPERTLDEWLAQADKLIAEGRHREAVRCLYLACLLKFDEANVARFIRSQTNWEHLARIEKSSKLPPDLEFRQPTQAFDRIWYGFRINGMDDVSRFRQWYTDIGERLKVAA